MDKAAQDQHEVHSLKRRGRPPKTKPEEIEMQETPAQRLAARIFFGQSPDLPMKERMQRVEQGLKAQGYSMEGVSL